MQVVSGRPNSLPNLTALRFFAASYVVLFHFAPRAPLSASPDLSRRLLDAGFTGVSLFFILSGFILAYNHQQVDNVKAFLRARFARIYPLYLFAILLLLPVVFHVAKRDPTALWALAADLLLVQTWFPSVAMGVNPPAWTLSCEVFSMSRFRFFSPRWQGS